MSLPEETTSHCPALLYPKESPLSSSSHGLWRVSKPIPKRSDCCHVLYRMYLCLWLLTPETIIVLHCLPRWKIKCSSDALHFLQNLVLTHYFPTGQTDITPLFEGRVSLDVDVAKGKANLKISSISLADNKVFECRVQIPGDDEGKLVDTTRLVVLGDTSRYSFFFISLFSYYTDIILASNVSVFAMLKHLTFQIKKLQ